MTQIKPLPLNAIKVSHNPRKPLKKLQEMGFDPMAFVHEFALSDDADKRKHFVETIISTHPEIERMCKSVNDRGQIQPIVVREYTEDNEVRYGIACGERRYIAVAFEQAVTGEPKEIGAVVRNLTPDEAYWLGVEENLIREDMTEIEKGEIFAEYAKKHETSMSDVADHFHVEYSYARGRAALATKLPEERRKLYEEGKLNLTDAIKEALGETAHRPKAPRDSHATRLTVTEIRKLFDTTLRNNTERLTAFAEVMKLDLNTALAESDERLAGGEEADARQEERRTKGHRRARAAAEDGE